jgi:hypothetical protein
MARRTKDGLTISTSKRKPTEGQQLWNQFASSVVRADVERANQIKALPKAEQSWWTSAPREGFSDRAKEHEARMSASRMAAYVSPMLVP